MCVSGKTASERKCVKLLRVKGSSLCGVPWWLCNTSNRFYKQVLQIRGNVQFFSTNVDILPLLFKQAIIAPNKLIGSWSALQTSQKENNNRIPSTLTFHPHNHAVKSIIFKNFKLLQNDPDTGRIFSQPPLISFKRDKNIGNFVVSSAFKTSEQPGTFKCARARCKTCPFIYNVEKLFGPKRSIKITDHFTCTSANVIYCITCTLCKKLYIGETSRRLGDL